MWNRTLLTESNIQALILPSFYSKVKAYFVTSAQFLPVLRVTLKGIAQETSSSRYFPMFLVHISITLISICIVFVVCYTLRHVFLN